MFGSPCGHATNSIAQVVHTHNLLLLDLRHPDRDARRSGVHRFSIVRRHSTFRLLIIGTECLRLRTQVKGRNEKESCDSRRSRGRLSLAFFPLCLSRERERGGSRLEKKSFGKTERFHISSSGKKFILMLMTSDGLESSTRRLAIVTLCLLSDRWEMLLFFFFTCCLLRSPSILERGGGQSTLMEFRGLMARSQTIGKRVGVHQQQQQKKKKKTRNNANVMSRREADVPG